MAGEDLSPTQFAALATILKHGELSQNHLGRLTAMDPSTISIVVRKLLKNGLITRSASEKDQRLSMIALTDKAYRLHARPARTQRGSCTARCSRRFRRPSRQTLLRLLHRINDDDPSTGDGGKSAAVQTFSTTNRREHAHVAPSPRRQPTKLVVRNIGLMLCGTLEQPILDADTIVVADGRITASARPGIIDTGTGATRSSTRRAARSRRA